jgi:energy-coupling factor transporter ATP-binding protein EcfA2
MPLTFTTSAKEAVSQGCKILVYGPSGSGKTVLAATMPNSVLLSAEAGALALNKSNLEKIFGVGNPQITYDVPMVIIRNVDDLTDAYRWASTSSEARNFEGISLDSISEIAEVVLNNAKRQVKDPRQAYGELIEKMETLIRLFRDLPGKHVYMAAKVEPMKDELSGAVKYGVSMPGAKLGHKLPYFYDFVFRLGLNKDTAGNNYRFLQTGPDLQFEAKDRSGRLNFMEFPHLGLIIQKATS